MKMTDIMKKHHSESKSENLDAILQKSCLYLQIISLKKIQNSKKHIKSSVKSKSRKITK